MKTFLSDLQTFLHTNANPQRAEKEKAYLYSDLKHYGVSVWQTRKFVNQRKRFLQSLSKKQLLNLVKKLWSKPSHEERSIALMILNSRADELDSSDLSLIEKLMRESKGWAHLDNLIIPIMPTLLRKDPSLYTTLKTWITDSDFWVRRSALLAQLLFFRHDDGGKRQLFFKLAQSQFNEDWIDKLYTDKLQNKRAKFFIRKAIGWTLREMSHKQPQVVFNFLKQHKHHMSGLSFREGSRKLPARMQAQLAG